MKDIHILNPEPITELVTEQQLRGFQFKKAPQAALTVVDNTVFVSNASNSVADSGIATLNNMRTRIANLEDRLIKLGLIQKT